MFFSGDFDSGNLEGVEQLGPYEVCVVNYKVSIGCGRATTIPPTSVATKRSFISVWLAFRTVG